MGKSMARAVRFRPQRVLRAADQLLEAQRVKSRPRWHEPLQRVPPSQILLRPLQNRLNPHRTVAEEQFLIPGQQIFNGRPLQSSTRVDEPIDRSVLNFIAAGGLALHGERQVRSTKGMYKPKNIDYAEDELRDEFFGDHPWELARPRVVVETAGGHDAKQWDWSTGIEQPGKQLDGESVVQRQNWLMQHAPFPSQAAAYDQARKEFYTVRRKQEIERRVATEEARAVGAIFGPSTLEYGMRLEDEVWDRWRELANADLDKREARRSNQSLSFGLDPDKGTARQIARKPDNAVSGGGLEALPGQAAQQATGVRGRRRVGLGNLPQAV